MIDNPISPRGDGNTKNAHVKDALAVGKSITPFPREGTETSCDYRACGEAFRIDNPISPRGDGNLKVLVVVMMVPFYMIDNPISPRGDGN